MRGRAADRDDSRCLFLSERLDFRRCSARTHQRRIITIAGSRADITRSTRVLRPGHAVIIADKRDSTAGARAAEPVGVVVWLMCLRRAVPCLGPDARAAPPDYPPASLGRGLSAVQRAWSVRYRALGVTLAPVAVVPRSEVAVVFAALIGSACPQGKLALAPAAARRRGPGVAPSSFRIRDQAIAFYPRMRSSLLVGAALPSARRLHLTKLAGRSAACSSRAATGGRRGHAAGLVAKRGQRARDPDDRLASVYRRSIARLVSQRLDPMRVAECRENAGALSCEPQISAAKSFCIG